MIASEKSKPTAVLKQAGSTINPYTKKGRGYLPCLFNINIKKFDE